MLKCILNGFINKFFYVDQALSIEDTWYLNMFIIYPKWYIGKNKL
jgi:hypothetical protein